MLDREGFYNILLSKGATVFNMMFVWLSLHNLVHFVHQVKWDNLEEGSNKAVAV